MGVWAERVEKIEEFGDILRVAYRREGQLHVASPQDSLLEGDDVYFVAAAEDVTRTLSLFGRESRKVSRVVIVGAGNVGLQVARMLEKHSERPRVKMIDRDRQRAHRGLRRLAQPPFVVRRPFWLRER